MTHAQVRGAFPFILAAVGAILCAGPVAANTLLVGPNQQFKLPSEAMKAAKDGDTIEIEPVKDGYFDCAVVPQNNLVIEGKGDGVVLTDKTCKGKAILVIDGKNVTVRNLTLQRARVPDHNGAGIRAEGGDLHIDRVRFLNNENGILAAPAPDATITVLNSEFIGNGKCEGSCAHGIYVNELKLLHIEHSVFRDTHRGHHIKSVATRTELIGNTIEDGPTGTASYLVDIPLGGSLIMRDNIMEKGPKAENHTAAVRIGEDGIQVRTKEITITGNTFTNDMSYPTIFIDNVTATEAQLANNTLKGKIRALEGDGSVR